jgi:hypothetical protein
LPQIGVFRSVRQHAHMHLPLLIGLWTGRREGDKGRRKGKRNRAAIIVIPVAAPLKAALDAELVLRRDREGVAVSLLSIEDEAICLTRYDNPWREGRLQRTHFELSQGQAGSGGCEPEAARRRDGASRGRHQLTAPAVAVSTSIPTHGPVSALSSAKGSFRLSERRFRRSCRLNPGR